MGPFGMSATMLQRVGEKAAYNSLRIKVEGLLVQTKDNSKPQVFKVLLIEDNRIQAHQTQDWLEGTSFEVEWADRLKLGLERLKKGGVDIVILDLNLPDSRGVATFEKLHAEIPEIPIVVLTGEFDESLGPETVAKGAQDYVVKQLSYCTSLVHVLAYAMARHKLQMEKIQSLQRSETGHVIGFVGAKGGVGTTTVALNVAVALANQGKTVILVEMRPSFGTLAIHLNLSPERTLKTLLKIAAEQITYQDLKSVLCNGPAGVSIVFGPQETETEFEEIDPACGEAIIKGFSELAQFVILDLPSQPSAATRAAAKLCHFAAVVTEREPGSVRAGRVAVKQLRALGVGKTVTGGGVRIGSIIVNRANYSSSIMSFTEIQSEMGCEIIGIVPNGATENLRALRESIPLLLLQPDSDAAISLVEIANRLSVNNVVAIQPSQGFSLLKESSLV